MWNLIIVFLLTLCRLDCLMKTQNFFPLTMGQIYSQLLDSIDHRRKIKKDDVTY